MILPLYIIRHYLKYAAGALVISTMLFLLFDFIDKSQRYFPKYNVSAPLIGKYYLLQIPNLLIQNIPIAALFASVITMVILNRSNEITAMRAAGVSPIRLAVPLLVGGIFLSVISFAIGEYVVPKASRAARIVENVEIEGRTSSLMNDGSTWLRNDSVVYKFKYYEPRTQAIIDLNIQTLGKKFRPVKTVYAKEAVADGGNWILRKVTISRFHPDGTRAAIEHIDSQTTQLPFTPKGLEKEQRRNVERSIEDLRSQIRNSQGSGLDVKLLQMDMHKKLAFAFAALVVSLVGLRFGYHSERNVETVRGVLLAIFIGLSYWLVLTAGQTLGRQEFMGPIVSAWLANVVVFSICVGEFVWHVKFKEQL